MDSVSVNQLRTRDIDYIKIISHGFLIVVLVLFLYDTLGLSNKTSFIPLLFILGSFLCLFAHYVISISHSDNMFELLQKKGANEESDSKGGHDGPQHTAEDREAGTNALSIDDIHLFPFLKITGWLLSFAVAAFYIGFFISVLIFVFVYMYWKTEKFENAYRAGYSIGGSVSITILTYILMIEILRRTLLLRVGEINIFSYIWPL